MDPFQFSAGIGRGLRAYAEYLLIPVFILMSIGCGWGLFLWDRADTERQRKTLECLAACEARGALEFRVERDQCLCMYRVESR